MCVQYKIYWHIENMICKFLPPNMVLEVTKGFFNFSGKHYFSSEFLLQ